MTTKTLLKSVRCSGGSPDGTRRDQASWLEHFDMFGQEVKLTFQNKTQFRTNCGGAASLLTFGIFLLFFCLRTIKMTGKSDPLISMTTTPLPKDQREIDLWKYNFMFAVTKLDPRVG